MKINPISTTLLLILVLLFLHTGCVTNQSTIENSIELAADTTSDGMRLAFNEIPSDTTRIFVYISLLKDRSRPKMFAI